TKFGFEIIFKFTCYNWNYFMDHLFVFVVFEVAISTSFLLHKMLLIRLAIVRVNNTPRKTAPNPTRKTTHSLLFTLGKTIK
ncbi:MAG: hypothetical protein WAU12_08170, partial [Saprospiraceae bacterium]